MGIPAEELIIRPFQEVVERGREAVANAQNADAESLARAGTALVREGERALKRLHPVWGGQVAKYGNAFKEAILQKDDIEARRRLLEDLLYDFEDYIEPATFDADRFAELQAATRAFALDVINHAKRLKLPLPIPYSDTPAAPADDQDGAASPPSASPSPLSSAPPVRGNFKLFPPLPPLPPMPPMPPLSSLPPLPTMPPTSSIPSIPPIPPIPAHALENTPRTSSLARRQESARAASGYAYSSNGNGRSHMRNAAVPPGEAAAGTGMDEDAFFDTGHSPEAGHMFPGGPPRSYSGHVPPAARGVQRTSTQSSAARSTGTPASPGGSPTAGPDVERFSSCTSSPAGNTSISGGGLTQPRTSATTAWVARQQSGLNGISSSSNSISNSSAAANRSRASLARARASRDTTMSADSVGSFLSQPYAMSTGGTATTAATTASSPSVADSPLLTDARASFFSTSYESEEASCAPVLPFIAPPIASATVPMSGFSGNRFSDVIQFSPSPAVPPIQLPASASRPKTAPQTVQPEYKIDVVELTKPESEAEPDAHSEPAPGNAPTQEPVLSLNQLPDRDGGRHDDDHAQETEKNQPPQLERPPSVDGTQTTALEADMPFTHHHEVREPDCSIGPQSSFRRMGGFCSGADACRGTGHWRGIELTSGFVGSRQKSIGRCVGCGYAHSYSEVRLDKEKKPEATFTKFGVHFRLRLLYKSHMAKHMSSQRQTDSMYGCVFCAQTGATPHEGDTTVFISVNDLLQHIARHPRPLPEVPGVTVLYGPGGKIKARNGESTRSDDDEDGDLDENDFDVRFVNPDPLPWPVPADVAAQCAVAVATHDHMQWTDEKPLARPPPIGSGDAPSNSSSSSVSPSEHMSELLPFLAGARIIGVVFPVAWEGKWCVGWHGGVAGAFPARLVRIQMPQPSELPMESSSSGMSVVARWRWKPEAEKEKKDKDKDHKQAPGWLTFDKGEVISNVQCLYADHWCWAGTNSKGRFGVFPQSHINTSTLQQESRMAPSVRSTKSGWAARNIFHKGGGGSSNGGSKAGKAGKAGRTGSSTVRPLSGSSSSAKTASSIGWPGY